MSDDLLLLDDMLARRTAERVPLGKAKQEISEARRAGKLTVSGVLTEWRGAPAPFAPAPAPIEHGRVVIDFVDPAQWFEWNWEANQAKRYVDGEKGLLDYRDVGAPRHEFEALFGALKRKPSSKDLVVAKSRELIGHWPGTKKQLANHLSTWLQTEHPDAPAMTPKVVERYLPRWRGRKVTNPR